MASANTTDQPPRASSGSQTQETKKLRRAADWVPSFKDEREKDWSFNVPEADVHDYLLTITIGLPITQADKADFKLRAAMYLPQLYACMYQTGQKWVSIEYMKFLLLRSLYMHKLNKTAEDFRNLKLATPRLDANDVDHGYGEWLEVHEPDFFRHKYRVPLIVPKPTLSPKAPAAKSASTAPTALAAPAPTVSSRGTHRTNPAPVPTSASAHALTVSNRGSYRPSPADSPAPATPSTVSNRGTYRTNPAATPAPAPTVSDRGTHGTDPAPTAATTPAPLASVPNHGLTLGPVADDRIPTNEIQDMAKEGRKEREDYYKLIGLSQAHLDPDGYPFEVRIPSHIGREMQGRLFKSDEQLQQVATCLDPRLRIIWTEHHGGVFLVVIKNAGVASPLLEISSYNTYWNYLLDYSTKLFTETPTLYDFVKFSVRSQALTPGVSSKCSLRLQLHELHAAQRQKQQQENNDSHSHIEKKRKLDDVESLTWERYMETNNASF